MATTVLDARGTLVPQLRPLPSARPTDVAAPTQAAIAPTQAAIAPTQAAIAPTQAAIAPTQAATAPTQAVARRVPVAVVGVGAIGVLEALALLALSLTGLDELLTGGRTAGWLVAVVLVLLAGWIVLCAGSAAAMVDGAGRSLLVGVAYAETALVVGLLLVAVAFPFDNPTSLPVPALALLALAVPVGKLLLAGAPSARHWIAQGPRPRVRRPDPVRIHPGLATATLTAIGLTLFAVALLAPVTTGDTADQVPVVHSQE